MRYLQALLSLTLTYRKLILCICLMIGGYQLMLRQRSSLSRVPCLQVLHANPHFSPKLDSDAKTWQPDGCSLIPYAETHQRWRLGKCLHDLQFITSKRRIYILLIGDSRLRQLQMGLQQVFSQETDKFCDVANATKLATSLWRICHDTKNDGSVKMSKHSSLTRLYPQLNLILQLHWMAYFEAEHQLEALFEDLKKMSDSQLPSLIVLGAGLWQITKRCHKDKIPTTKCAQIHNRKFLEMKPELEALSKRTMVIWAGQTPLLQENLQWNISNENQLIHTFNLDIQHNLRSTDVHFWSSFPQIFSYLADTKDGYHLGQKILTTDVQILVNILCDPIKQIHTEFCCSLT